MVLQKLLPQPAPPPYFEEYRSWVESLFLEPKIEIKYTCKGNDLYFELPRGRTIGITKSTSKDKAIICLKEGTLHQIASDIAYGKEMKLNLTKLTEQEKKIFNDKVESHIKFFRDKIKENEERISRLKQYL